MQIKNLLLAGSLLALAAGPVAAAYDGAVTAGNTSVWRIDSKTGSVSLCSEARRRSPADCYPPSQVEKKGDYRILVGNDIMSTWRINTDTGAVSKCEYDDTDSPPICSPWSK